MKKNQLNDEQIISSEEEPEIREEKAAEQVPVSETEKLTNELKELNDKYVRLYAEFENYKKRVNKEKEELVKYGNESIIYDMLTVIDNLDMALKHASNDVSRGLVQGVEITYKELKKTLEKYGLAEIEAEGKPFDPAVHHAMSQMERDDVGENTVIEEYRKGYMFREKVLRPSLVAVSKRSDESRKEETEEIGINKNTEEES